MRPQVFQGPRTEREYNLMLARRLEDRATIAELWYRDEEAKGLRQAAANFRQRALGNPTPEMEMQS